MRKKIFYVSLIACSLTGWSCNNQDTLKQTTSDPAELITQMGFNSLGFLPASPKVASLQTDAEQFYIRNAENHQLIFEGALSAPQSQKDVNQTIRTADFSTLTEPGTYYLEIPGKYRSIDFDIQSDVYNEPYITTMRAFYLWRCGMAVSGEHQGKQYQQQACHLHDGYDDYLGNPSHQRKGTGGWHDAGDYGKYTVNAGVTLGILFRAWEAFQPKLEQLTLNLPETAPGYPEFLKELKWETDWLLTMPYPDGSGRVSHKLTRQHFSGFIMPDQDQEKRYFTTFSSAATADFTAMMAQAARIFKPYDANYAQQCLDAALNSYQYLAGHPENVNFEQGDFTTGGYQTDDADDRLWAAAELWETTGEARFLNDFETRMEAMNYAVDQNWDWGNVGNLGVFTYLLSSRSVKDSKIVNQLRDNTIATANTILEKSKQDVYARPLGDMYYWGCNGGVARQVVNLYVANQLNANGQYANAALDAIGHLFGRNRYNRSYVTGLGYNPPLFPHDRRSAADGITAPWPGYIVGGGETATDWVDDQDSYRTNEIAINWQAPLVFALAWFIQ